MLEIGAILAGLVLLVRPLPGIIKAMTSGVIIGKGHAAPRIERTAEPERFRKLLGQRMAEMIPGLVILAGVVVFEVVTGTLLLAAKGPPPHP